MPDKSVEINFEEYSRHMHKGKGGRVLLLKAVGLNKRKDLRVLDATAGLMRDAFFMAKFGGEVVAIERSPLLIAMIKAACEKYDFKLINVSLDFIAGDATQLIPVLDEFDVIYLDPMFRTEQSAKAKKDLQFLQQLHQDEREDAALLFEVALKHAKARVVIKRARHAPYLTGLKPDWSYLGQSVRFDVYLAKNALPSPQK